jgi:hypothetical protein
MNARLFLAMIEALDEQNVATGARSAREQIEKLRAYLEGGGDLDGATIGFKVASAMARSSTERTVRQSATKKKLTPERYLVAEARNAGKKWAMAKELKVTERGLRKYERENEMKLAMLRPEFDAIARATLIRLLTNRTGTE